MCMRKPFHDEFLSESFNLCDSILNHSIEFSCIFSTVWVTDYKTETCTQQTTVNKKLQSYTWFALFLFESWRKLLSKSHIIIILSIKMVGVGFVSDRSYSTNFQMNFVISFVTCSKNRAIEWNNMKWKHYHAYDDDNSYIRFCCCRC